MSAARQFCQKELIESCMENLDPTLKNQVFVSYFVNYE